MIIDRLTAEAYDLKQELEDLHTTIGALTTRVIVLTQELERYKEVFGDLEEPEPEPEPEPKDIPRDNIWWPYIPEFDLPYEEEEDPEPPDYPVPGTHSS